MSLFESFLGHAAGAGAQIIGDQMKSENLLNNEREMLKMREELALEREKTVQEMREAAGIRAEDRAQERADAPLKRIGGLISKFKDQEMPMEAAPVTSLTGQGTAIDGQALKSGLQGDPAKMRAIAMAMPEGEDKSNILKQLDSQMATDTATNQAAVAGKTRKMNIDDAEKAALDDALANDPVAYAAYQAKIGAPKRAERKDDLREKKMDVESADRNRRMDWQQEFQTRQADRQDRLAELTMGRQDRSESKSDERAKLASLNTLVKDASGEAERLRVRLADPMLDEATKKIYANQLLEVAATHKQAVTALSGLAGIPEKPTETKKGITQAEYAALPSGSIFTAPDGTQRRKP